MAKRITRTPVTENYEASGMDEFALDNDTDDIPAVTSRAQSSASPVGSGWGAPREARRETVKAPYLVLKGNGKRIVKLLDSEPVVRFWQHFVNSAKRSYTCSNDDACVMCAAGHKANLRFMMNVVDMEKPDEVATWTFGPEVGGLLQSFGEEKRSSPLNRENLYFQVYQFKT